MTSTSKIIYTHTDEAPALATHSFLPIVQAFAGAAGIELETRDISLAGRILAVFPDHLTEEQRVSDDLAELGALTQDPNANIIKLPNISASIPQLKAAVAELQAKGYALPDYPDEPQTAEEKGIQARYDSVKGSAVNPVLREGNSDRRAPAAVKEFARNHPHSMGAWSADSDTHVATMGEDDFRSSELSHTFDADDAVTIELVHENGDVETLKGPIPILAGEVIDAARMRKAALVSFLTDQIAEARDSGVLFSLHVKATMMKVSDPIIFGHAVKAYFADVFATYADELDESGANPNNGLGNVLASLQELPDAKRTEIEAAITATIAGGPDIAMVNSDKGITNLHVPSDVIIDASIPAMIRSSGQMWNKDGELQDTKATIPDSSYAELFAATIEYSKEHGAFDPTTMGTVPNVGLMAQKAEEYGSHDKTFELEAAGAVRVVDSSGATIIEHDVAEGDVWRMSQTKDAPIQDWIKLGVNRARATGWPAVFWLDSTRAHDAELIKKVDKYLPDHDTDGLDIKVMGLREATQFTLARTAAGENTISVTGNVLRDYLTDLFPILEVGTSAKMLSIVPLMAGGGLFETGAGGSAPKHVQQFNQENHLRWDSLGEFLALAVSFEHLSGVTGNARAKVLGETLDIGATKYLAESKGPSRKAGELDNRGSHFYLAMYWAEALANQTDDADLAATFGPVFAEMAEKEATIVAELNAVQGEPMDIGGYYSVDLEQATAAMRPSATWNDLIASV